MSLMEVGHRSVLQMSNNRSKVGNDRGRHSTCDVHAKPDPCILRHRHTYIQQADKNPYIKEKCTTVKIQTELPTYAVQICLSFQGIHVSILGTFINILEYTFRLIPKLTQRKPVRFPVST